MELILASASERRKELLSKITPNFKIVVGDFDEDSVSFRGDCGEYVMKLALGKASCVAEKASEHSVVIGSDTVVFMNGKILGKPKNEEDAYAMLRELSGNTHQVFTGVAVIDTKQNRVLTDYACTFFKFSTMTESEIRDYIRTGDPFDKAGAYGIQGNAGVFVEEIQGDYYNVVGLPLNKLYKMLKEMGVNL